MNHKKKILIIVLFLQSWIFFSFLLTPNAHSENSNPMITRPSSLKISSNKIIVRILDDTQVNYNTTDKQTGPSICKLSKDTFVVAWNSYEQDGSDYGVYARVFNATTGKNITSEFRVNSYADLNQAGPSICALSKDTFAIAWQSNEQDGDDYGIYARVFDATTGKQITSEFQVNDYWDSDQLNPSICGLSDDTFAVAWDSYGQDGSWEGVYASVFDATTGNNITSEFRVNSHTQDPQLYPSICALSNDIVAVTWETFVQDGSLYGIYARVFNATTGKSITSEFQVNNYTFSNQGRPSICSLSDDTFAVAWDSSGQDGSSWGVYASVFNATTGKNITSEFRANYYTAGDQSRPSICAFSNDTFVITWDGAGLGGDGSGVYAGVFNSSTGNNILPEFRVNQYTENSQSNPTVCTLTNDTFTIAWMSDGQDGDQYGIYCSIFRIENYNPSSSLTFGPDDGDDDDDDDDKESIPFGSLYFAIFLISVLSLVLITRYKILKKGIKKKYILHE